MGCLYFSMLYGQFLTFYCFTINMVILINGFLFNVFEYVYERFSCWTCVCGVRSVCVSDVLPFFVFVS